MNYQKIYDFICNRAKLEEDLRISKKKNKEGYFERHHIIPKCMGGDNYSTNLVYLTGKEHFICHRLLCEIYPDNYKLKYALYGMVTRKSKGQYRYIPSAKIYQRLKEEFSTMISRKMAKRTVSDETRLKLSKASSGEKNNMYGSKHSLETIEKMSKAMSGEKNPMYGKHHSESTKLKISLKNKGKKAWNSGKRGLYSPSEETRKKISISRKGKKFSDEHKKRLALGHIGYKNKYKGISKLDMFIKKYGPEVGPEKYKQWIDLFKMKLQNRIIPKMICPHCNKEGDPGNMKRYHFDNCKLKK